MEYSLGEVKILHRKHSIHRLGGEKHALVRTGKA